MNDSDRRSPSLPQNDDPAGQRARARQLAEAKETYVWTTEVDTLPGVPLATKVPFADEPSIPWFITALKAALPVVENSLAGKAEGDDSGARAKLDEIRKSVDAIDERHGAAASPGEALEEGIGGLLDAAVGAVQHFAGGHEDTLKGHVEELLALAREHRAEGAADGLKAYRDLFVTLPVPAVADVFMEDATFARMRVAGPNPMLIEAVKTPSIEVPLAVANRVLGDGTPSWYQVDYAGLKTIVPGVVDGMQKYMWRPIAVFGRTADQQSIRPVAIQVDPTDDSTIVYPPADGKTDYTWEMAKFAVQVADGNYHELFVHLARTHLVEECFAMATRRALADNHPIAILLLPHFQGTLFINNAAAGGLIAKGGPIDNIFAGTIDTTQLAAADDRLAFDFAAHIPPTDFQTRGLLEASDLPDFPYRDDAMDIWSAIRDWTGAYVNTYYRDDGEVVSDTELAAWTSEVVGSGRMKGFGVPNTREKLAEALAMVIFTASAQHAAVNFPQRTLMTYAPNVTGAAWAPVDYKGATESAWVGMMPPLDRAAEQLQTLELLGGVYFSKLGEYKEAGFPYGAWFLDEAVTRQGGPLEAFQKTLREVEARIEQRNTERAVAYPYLLPTQIPQSINI